MYFTQFGDQEKLKMIVHPIVTGSLSNYLITQRKCGKVLFILCFKKGPELNFSPQSAGYI